MSHRRHIAGCMYDTGSSSFFASAFSRTDLWQHATHRAKETQHSRSEQSSEQVRAVISVLGSKQHLVVWSSAKGEHTAPLLSATSCLFSVAVAHSDPSFDRSGAANRRGAACAEGRATASASRTVASVAARGDARARPGIAPTRPPVIRASVCGPRGRSSSEPISAARRGGSSHDGAARPDGEIGFLGRRNATGTSATRARGSDTTGTRRWLVTVDAKARSERVRNT